MKQILQSLKTGVTEVAEVPVPSPVRRGLLIRTSRTLISAGTERMLVEFGRANLLEKARQQPDKVKMVLDKIRTDGVASTVNAMQNKLDQPLPLGYCNVGRTLAISDGVSGFAVGDRVASNGKHAEVVAVPVNLCAKIPDSVSDDEASFTVVGAIALQGIRLLQPTLGEAVVVTGLGLIGLLTVQLLRAHGCRVLGIDYDPTKLEMARGFGAETVDLSIHQDPVSVAMAFSRGRGVDGVVITAATKSNDPVHQAALMCRQRGRIILVGVAGLELSRDDFFKKELTFQVSCSYGPGRYDAAYEDQGVDYPLGFVRWTEQRNFEAVLDMMSDHRLDVKPLISHRFTIDQAANAYELIASGEPSLGVVLEFPTRQEEPTGRSILLPPAVSRATIASPAAAVVSFVGSGNFATAALIPAFKQAGARLRTVASQSGVSGVHAGRKFGFVQTTTDPASVFTDEQTTAIVITTRHDTHARFVTEALKAGKHVFVEKPLCLTLAELAAIEALWNTLVATGSTAKVMVGFNRRFAPHVVKMKELLASTTGTKNFIVTVNAGAIPPDHWTQDRDIGGGRIVGEACHFIDLLRHLAGATITDVQTTSMLAATSDTVAIQLTFADGSIGTIHYFANGHKAFPKERIEVFVNGRVLQLDNFRKLRGIGWPDFTSMNIWRQDKGHSACAAAFVKSVQEGSPSPIPFSQLVEVSRAAIQAGGAHPQ